MEARSPLGFLKSISYICLETCEGNRELISSWCIRKKVKGLTMALEPILNQFNWLSYLESGAVPSCRKRCSFPTTLKLPPHLPFFNLKRLERTPIRNTTQTQKSEKVKLTQSLCSILLPSSCLHFPIDNTSVLLV